MKPIKNIDSVDKNNVILPETIEDKLNEAEKDYEEGRTLTEEETWGMFSKKYGLTYKYYLDSTKMKQCTQKKD